MKRVMCVHLPDWPLQRLVHERPDVRGRPVALINSRAARGAEVVYCCALAQQRGIRVHMPVAEARAKVGELFVEEEDADGDRRGLEQLAEWAQRYSPLIGLEEGPAPHDLLIDVTGCADYFYGEEALAALAERDWHEAGWNARIAIAATIGAAWGLAHYTRAPRVIPSNETEEALLCLPCAALRLPAETLALLTALGIDQVGQLMALPRASLPRRFGERVLERLDQALGTRTELLVPYRPPPEVQAEQAFEYAIERLDILHQVLDTLTQSVEDQLRHRNRGARQFELWLHHEGSAPVRLPVGLLRPSRSAVYLAMLLRVQLERVQLREPVTGMSLRALVIEPIVPTQADLFETERAYKEELSELLDRLSNRLGRNAVARPRLVADMQPEYAFRFEPVLSPAEEKRRLSASGAQAHAARRAPKKLPVERMDFALEPGQRPLRVWPRPEKMHVTALSAQGVPLRFLWQNERYQVVRVWGPERIATGWWRGNDVRRDYYVAATAQGTRLWIFRRLADCAWFVHGCFD